MSRCYDIISVWSAHGHAFISAGEHEYNDDGVEIGEYHDCLTCGAHYVLRLTPDAHADGAYMANNGDDPTECSRYCLVHGDPHETGHELDCPDGCEHCTHDCNCLLCNN